MIQRNKNSLSFYIAILFHISDQNMEKNKLRQLGIYGKKQPSKIAGRIHNYL
jgi:hypothetical protein